MKDIIFGQSSQHSQLGKESLWWAHPILSGYWPDWSAQLPPANRVGNPTPRLPAKSEHSSRMRRHEPIFLSRPDKFRPLISWLVGNASIFSESNYTGIFEFRQWNIWGPYWKIPNYKNIISNEKLKKLPGHVKSWTHHFHAKPRQLIQFFFCLLEVYCSKRHYQLFLFRRKWEKIFC